MDRPCPSVHFMDRTFGLFPFLAVRDAAVCGCECLSVHAYSFLLGAHLGVELLVFILFEEEFSPSSSSLAVSVDSGVQEVTMDPSLGTSSSVDRMAVEERDTFVLGWSELWSTERHYVNTWPLTH